MAEVFTMSAIDLFASAMGAFLIITIILMPDYRKEVMAEGDNTLLERLMAESLDALEDRDDEKSEAQQRKAFAQQELADLMAQASRLRNEITEAEEQLMADFDPPPPPEPSEDLSPVDEVSFRFLGLKTDERRFLFVVDLNRFLEPHAGLMAQTVSRTLDSLRDQHEFAILAFNQQDSGPVFQRWPADGRLVNASRRNLTGARGFLEGLEGQFVGSSPILQALRTGLDSDADAIVLFSDGLPNPRYNEGLDGAGIVSRISRENRQQKEIHAVTIGDYFKYRDTIQFMETLAKANGGGFMALAR
ncbi:MAG: hypothetical protein AAGH19_07830 [Pseudomonadota bacterium]